MLYSLRKYATGLTAGTAGADLVRMSIRKSGSDTFATGSDWTPASGDVKVSKDGGAQANIGTLPSYNNGSWEFTLSGTELTAKTIRVIISNAAIINDDFTIETFGNASAMYGGNDYTDGVRMGMSALPSSGTIPTVGTGANQIALSSGAVTVGTNNDKTGYSLTQAFPTHFSSMAIDASGYVTVGTNNDKTGYSLSQAFPSNFSTLVIDGSGHVVAASVSGNVSGNVTGDVIGNVRGGILGGGVFSLNSPGVMAILATTDTTAITVANNLNATVSSRLAASSYTAPPSAASVAQAVLTDTSDLTTAGSIGKIISTNLDTTVSSRLATTSYTAPDNADIATALSDLVTLLGRTDPTTAITAIKTVTDKVATMLATSGSNYTLTQDALKNAPGGGALGTGNIPVTQDTGGVDNLRFVDGNGNGIDEASITAFLASEYTANPLTATPRGQSFTKTDGRWTDVMMLDSGNYIFVFEAPGYQVSTMTATV